MLKKALITGASGFLGSIISSSSLNSIYQIKTLGKKKENNFSVDLADENLKFQISETFDIIIHTAGKAHSVPKTQSEKQVFYKTNFEGTKKLCDILSSSKNIPKSFIFISSVSVYGIDEGELISEDYLLNGLSPYAKSKILAEEWLLQWANDYDVNLSILRLPLVVGPNPPGNLGLMIKGMRSGKYLSIGNANAKKSMVLAEDIVKIIPRLAEIGGIYNLTDGYHPTLGELENIISLALGKKSPLKIPQSMAMIIAFIGDFFGETSPITRDKLKKITSSLTFDDSKARKILGWQSTPVLQKLPYII
jgi:nucleoside-diphosphate-sugar epimerase